MARCTVPRRIKKGQAVYFDDGLGKSIAARMEAEQRLRLAIRDRRFVCAFQPKVNIHTQEVSGFETLVRWRDSDGEIHAPGQFINLAIELGLINPITNFVLAETIASIDRLDAVFGAGKSISINVGAKQASDLTFMSSLAGVIRQSGYGQRLILELTEDAIVDNGLFQSAVLPELRELGVRISIDDFGTGYSSLSALADIVADEIKIDRAFISRIHERPRSQSVLRAVESLAQSLQMSVVAEGVETQEELIYLQTASRIRFAQGFYFSKPIYLDDVRSGAKFGERVGESRMNEPERAAGRLTAPARVR
jgi:cyclic di-GMP phosphodiesterase Gmr